LRNCREGELILGTAWAAQPKPSNSQDALKVCKKHLHTFSIVARLLEGLGVNECTGGVARIFVDAAWNFALRRLRAAFGLQRARAAIGGPCAIEERLSIMNSARRMQELALRAHIDVAILVELEVLSAQ